MCACVLCLCCVAFTEPTAVLEYITEGGACTDKTHTAPGLLPLQWARRSVHRHDTICVLLWSPSPSIKAVVQQFRVPVSLRLLGRSSYDICVFRDIKLVQYTYIVCVV